MYTKRNFRCDCGNGKFGGKVTCALEPKKKAENEENEYNQNFDGVYCTCSRPYPDPENEDEDEMIQCVVCEDWYHGIHLKTADKKLPKSHQYAEMICQLCVEKFDFLGAYEELAVNHVAEDKDVDVETPAKKARLDICLLKAWMDKQREVLKSDIKVEDKADAKVEDKADVKADSKADVEVDCKTENQADSKVNIEANLKAEGQAESKANIKDEGPTDSKANLKGRNALFMPGEWRKKLCVCDDCTKMYKERKVAFLIDEEDTVHHYEAKAEDDDKADSYETGMKALSEMDRVKQVEAIQSYNAMKSGLMDYLKKFADGKKVVKPEDIQTFFEQMKKSPKKNVEIPKFCR